MDAERARPDSRQTSKAYLLFTLVLSVLAILALAVDVVLKPAPEIRAILGYTDTAICALFFIDFLIQLAQAENRLKYMARWGWLDLLSSMPAVEVLRFGRLARILRILRVLRSVKSARILTSMILERRAQSAFLAAVLMTIVLMTVGAISVLHFEDAPESNIKTPEDALWWAIVTLTTVGYGDRFPVTSEGRFIAVVLMISGVGLFGALSGFVAASFLKPTQKEEISSFDRVEVELRQIKEDIAALKRT